MSKVLNFKYFAWKMIKVKVDKGLLPIIKDI